MRTSLNEIKLVDGHLFNNGTVEDALVFDAMRIINPELNQEIAWQRQTHGMVQQYSRKKLKAEIEAVHQRLFNEKVHSSFKEKILGFFNIG